MASPPKDATRFWTEVAGPVFHGIEKSYNRSVRAAGTSIAAVMLASGSAFAQQGTPSRDDGTMRLEADTKSEDKPAAAEVAPPIEAPPPPPRKKGFVLDATLGGLGFLGSFRRVAPLAPWMHLLFGFEPA